MKQYLGLDIGSALTKAVVLSGKGADLQISEYGIFDAAEEGILNDTELYQSVSQWLEGKHWGKCIKTTSLPQFMTTTMERDFPAVGNGAGKNIKLDAMIKYDISQVSGLSDEALITDFCPLPSGLDRKNPVVIGLCREQAVRDKVTILDGAGIKVDNLAITGLALANAFIKLHAVDAAKSEPALILDIGRENTTAVVLAAGQPLFVGSLMCAGDKFEAACKNDTRAGAAKTLTDVNLMEEIGQSPLMMAARLLENEIQVSIETWRAQETGKMAEAVFSSVYICGGFSRINGLKEWLQETLETPVHMLGPKIDGEIKPEYTLAYGMALQSAGVASISLSLMPEDVKNLNIRKSDWIYLAAAMGVLFLSLICWEVKWYVSTSSRISEGREQYEKLDKCGELIERIRVAENALYSNESKLIPLVSAGNQAENLKAAVKSIGDACGGEEWFVYLGDDASFQSGRKNVKVDVPKKNGVTDMFGGNADAGEYAGVAEFQIKMLPVDVPVTTKYTAACFTPLVQNHPYDLAKEFVARLEKSPLFKGVDILDGNNISGREDVFKAWREWLSHVRGQYKPFMFTLPFETSDIDKSVIPEPKKGKAKGKK